MKQLFVILSALLLTCCSSDSEVNAENNSTSNMNQKLYITIDGRTETATLVDNAATQSLVAALQEAPITATLNDKDFEIWGSLGRNHQIRQHYERKRQTD